MPVTLTLEAKNSGTTVEVGEPIGLLLCLTQAVELETGLSITLEAKS